MTEKNEELRRALSNFKMDGFSVVDLVEVSPQRNAASLEEVIQQFDSDDSASGAVSYILRVKPAKEIMRTPELSVPVPPSVVPETSPIQQLASDIHTADGALNVPYLIKNARLLFDANETDLALNIYKAILKDNEGNPEALAGLGKCFERQGKLEDAEASYRESIAYDPQLKTFRLLISMQVRQKKYKESAETIERALRIIGLSDKEKFSLHHAAGNCWMRIEEVELAEGHYHEALEFESQSAAIHSNLGSLYLQAGRIGESVKAFEAAIKSGKAANKAYLGLGCCYIAHGRKADALEAFIHALEKKLDDPTAIFYLVKCAYETRRYEKAEPWVKKYAEAAPVNPNLLYCLAGLQYHTGNLEESKKTAERILGIRPGHVGAKELIGIIARSS